jgi:hypothetical protein
MAEMVAYCEQDVRAMREISKSMRPLSDEELADYHVNERINDRGVLVDTALCRAALATPRPSWPRSKTIVSRGVQGRDYQRAVAQDAPVGAG